MTMDLGRLNSAPKEIDKTALALMILQSIPPDGENDSVKKLRTAAADKVREALQ